MTTVIVHDLPGLENYFLNFKEFPWFMHSAWERCI